MLRFVEKPMEEVRILDSHLFFNTKLVSPGIILPKAFMLLMLAMIFERKGTPLAS